MGDITENFSWSEFERTSHADLQEKNRIPDDGVRENIRSLCETVLQPLRDALGVALTVSSGYRCPELNARLPKASATSQHMKGEAADIRSGVLSPFEIAAEAKSLGLPYDQMILYPTFVHLSHKREGAQRGQILHDSSYKGERL